VLPIVGREPVVEDAILVDREFGTKPRSLPRTTPTTSRSASVTLLRSGSVLTEMTAEAGEAGRPLEACKRIVARLEQEGRLVAAEP
jgi:hypothetical protein